MKTVFNALLASLAVALTACGNGNSFDAFGTSQSEVYSCPAPEGPTTTCHREQTLLRSCTEYRGTTSTQELEDQCKAGGGQFDASSSCPLSDALLGWCESASDDGTTVHYYYQDDSLFATDEVPRAVCESVGTNPWCSVR